MANTVGVTFSLGAELHKIQTKFKSDIYEVHLKAWGFALLLEEPEVI